MGGEFYLIVRKNATITQSEWERALIKMITKFAGRLGDSDHVFHPADGKGKYAFEYVDPYATWGGVDPKPKSFRLQWKWGPDAIESDLGGRRRIY